MSRLYEPDGRRVPRGRRRTLVAGICVAVVLAAMTAYVIFTQMAAVPLPVGSVHSRSVVVPAAASVIMSPIGESAISVSGADQYLGASSSAALAASGGDGALPIASISKLITAMVILDAKPLASASDAGPTLAFDKADADLYDKYYVLNATVASMRSNSAMSERDVLSTMLVASACNYADVASTWAYGSQSRFLSATRTWLRAHGLNNTTIVEPTGIDARNTSTPSDLIALGKLAAADPVIAPMVAQTFIAFPQIGQLSSTNDILGQDGITGLKTGTLDGSGSNLLFSATVSVDGLKAPLTMIGVILGGDTRGSVDHSALAMIDSIKSGFHEVQVVKKGEVFGTYTTPWGRSSTVVSGATEQLFTWSNTPVTSVVKTRPVGSGAKGEGVGTITWKAGSSTVSAPLLLAKTIEGPDWFWRLTHPAELLR